MAHLLAQDSLRATERGSFGAPKRPRMWRKGGEKAEVSCLGGLVGHKSLSLRLASGPSEQEGPQAVCGPERRKLVLRKSNQSVCLRRAILGGEQRRAALPILISAALCCWRPPTRQSGQQAAVCQPQRARSTGHANQSAAKPQGARERAHFQCTSSALPAAR